jgi:benzodiazapine receptor
VILGASVAANLLGMSVNGQETGEIANTAFSDTVLFFPATYVFGTIWPVIYLGIIGLAIHQALPIQAANATYRRAGYLLAANLVLNALWVWVFGISEFVISFFLILPIVASAVLAYIWLEAGRSPAAPLVERVFKIAVGIYAAWLTVATIASAATALVSAGWNGFGLSDVAWTVIMTIVGTVLCIVLVLRYRDPTFAAVYAYAYIGILVRRIGTHESVALAAGVCAGVCVIVFVWSLVVRVRKQPATP